MLFDGPVEAFGRSSKPAIFCALLASVSLPRRSGEMAAAVPGGGGVQDERESLIGFPVFYRSVDDEAGV